MKPRKGRKEKKRKEKKRIRENTSSLKTRSAINASSIPLLTGLIMYISNTGRAHKKAKNRHVV
jgi:hypothetical protein